MTGVCIDLEPVVGRGDNGSSFFECSKNDGRFQMSMMPPGKYWLVAHDEVTWEGLKSRSTLYYPDVRDRERSTVVSIEAGKYVEHLDLKLPSNEKRFKVNGRMQFAHGAPVAAARVTFTSPQHGYSESTATNADGSFGLSVVDGMNGQLNGRLLVVEPILRSCPEFKVEPRRRGIVRFMDTIPIALSTGSDRSDITLELPFPSCRFWPPRD